MLHTFIPALWLAIAGGDYPGDAGRLVLVLPSLDIGVAGRPGGDSLVCRPIRHPGGAARLT